MPYNCELFVLGRITRSYKCQRIIIKEEKLLESLLIDRNTWYRGTEKKTSRK